jgi:hypothetical protein
LLQLKPAVADPASPIEESYTHNGIRHNALPRLARDRGYPRHPSSHSRSAHGRPAKDGPRCALYLSTSTGWVNYSPPALPTWYRADWCSTIPSPTSRSCGRIASAYCRKAKPAAAFIGRPIKAARFSFQSLCRAISAEGRKPAARLLRVRARRWVRIRRYARQRRSRPR